MKKIISLVIVLIMALTMLAGCAGSDTLKVGVLIYKYDDTYIAAVRQAIEQEAANYGLSLIHISTNFYLIELQWNAPPFYRWYNKYCLKDDINANLVARFLNINYLG